MTTDLKLLRAAGFVLGLIGCFLLALFVGPFCVWDDNRYSDD